MNSKKVAGFGKSFFEKDSPQFAKKVINAKNGQD